MKSIKERTFYALELDETEGSSLIGIWDNPSLAERELRRVVDEGKGFYTLKETKISNQEIFIECRVNGIFRPFKTFTMRPIKLNERLT